MVSYATIALVISIIFPVSVLAAVLWLFYLKEREHDRKSVDTKVGKRASDFAYLFVGGGLYANTSCL